MAALGQLTNALFSASQETSIGLANLHFDFAVIKVEAPSEYNGLGQALSKRRRDTAENGPLHITARKLGALFEGVMPKVPDLIQAYGKRASEIASSPEATPQDSARHSVFAEHVGMDGSTIWAAATSGGETVAVHLLACMLARIWAREEAVSIWQELVESRKTQLRVDTADISVIAKSRIELSREQLDAWDSGARAWLRTADAARMLQQTQLRLLVDNLSVPVASRGAVYETVIYAVTKALEALNNLIKGVPQQIDDGSILLGLTAWHIYPDISLAHTNAFAEQRDNLVKTGGIITIGLEKRGKSGKGVSWSLPLAHAKYYGEPIVAVRHLGIGESRVSFDGLLLVALGGILKGWGDDSLELDQQVELVEKLALAAGQGVNTPKPSPWYAIKRDGDEWLACLENAAAQYKRADEVLKKYKRQLIAFGKRKCASFLGPRNSLPPPVFGLVDFKVLMQCFDNDEARLKLLRQWALDELNEDTIRNGIIVYQTSGYALPRCTRIGVEADSSHKRRRTGTGRLPLPGSIPTWRISLDMDNSSDGITEHMWSYTEDRILPPDGRDYSMHIQDDTKVRMIPPRPGDAPAPYVLLYGDANLAAIYVPMGHVKNRPVNRMSLSQISRCFDRGDLPAYVVQNAIHAMNKKPAYQLHVESLHALSVATRIYSQLRGARVHLEVTSKPLIRSAWWREFQSMEMRRLQTLFSCIAYLETGVLDIKPSMIGDEAYAVCFETSMFVAESLIKDPKDAKEGAGVEWLLGNVGKPGLAFLITPPKPRIKKFDYSSWHVVSHGRFGGQAENNLKGTSFHLSLTGYQPAIHLDQGGHRETPAYFLETAISVYDQGKWIADVEILKSSARWRIISETTCEHSALENAEALSCLNMVCIDSWAEFMDPPTETAVVRAYGNPAARLAAAALALRSSKRVHVITGQPCWACYRYQDMMQIPRDDGNSPSADGAAGDTLNNSREESDSSDYTDDTEGEEEQQEGHKYRDSDDDGDEDEDDENDDEFDRLYDLESYAFHLPPIPEEPPKRKRKNDKKRGDTERVILIW